MTFTLEILLPGLAACFLLTLLLSYLGLQVLAREVIFVDIALAQVAALGSAVASYFGVEPHTTVSLVWSLGFTTLAAGVFAATRAVRVKVPQEAFIGIAYAAAAAFTVLVANALPHGDEELKETLVGNLLTVGYDDVLRIAAVFAAVAIVQVAFRRRFVTHSKEEPRDEGINEALWDLLFYVTFGFVITIAVHTAGVLLVFSYLIVPAVFSALFASRLWPRLALAWGLGAVVSSVGMWVSFELDLPSGATVVMTFGAALASAVAIYATVRALRPQVRAAEAPGLLPES